MLPSINVTTPFLSCLALGSSACAKKTGRDRLCPRCRCRCGSQPRGRLSMTMPAVGMGPFAPNVGPISLKLRPSSFTRPTIGFLVGALSPSGYILSLEYSRHSFRTGLCMNATAPKRAVRKKPAPGEQRVSARGHLNHTASAPPSVEPSVHAADHGPHEWEALKRSPERPAWWSRHMTAFFR